jgi:hypothetical protein
MKINNYTVHTGMGRIQNPNDLPLTEEQIKTLNEIGYSGGKNSNFKSRVEYLNSLDPKVQWDIKQTKFDDGDFSEMFIFTRVEKTFDEFVSDSKEKRADLKKQLEEMDEELVKKILSFTNDGLYSSMQKIVKDVIQPNINAGLLREDFCATKVLQDCVEVFKNSV